MTASRILGLLLLVLVVALPLRFRSQKWVRCVAVLGLLLVAFCSVQFGLGRAARNVSLPARDVMQQQVEYGTAWSAGRLATQEKVDLYRLNLIMIAAAMAVLALVPMRSANKKE